MVFQSFLLNNNIAVIVQLCFLSHRDNKDNAKLHAPVKRAQLIDK